LHPSGSVEVREHLVKHELKPRVAEAVATTSIEPSLAVRSSRSEFTASVIRYAGCQRSAAAQAALLKNPRKAKEVAALLMLLGHRADFGIKLTLHPCHFAPEEERADQRSHQAI